MSFQVCLRLSFYFKNNIVRYSSQIYFYSLYMSEHLHNACSPLFFACLYSKNVCGTFSVSFY